MSIVQALIEQVGVEIEQAAQRGRIVGLDLVIGRLSGVHIDSIRFAFELLSPGTLLDGAELRIQERHAVLACRDCSACHEIEQIRFDCPACGSSHVVLQGGQELLLQSIELAEEEEPGCPGAGP
jgi:hydrogenase nickel incorporation protein HypA/HybF